MRENYYNKNKLKYLKMIRGTKPVRSNSGKILKAEEFQSTESKTGRIHPDRKWFRATRTVSQNELDELRSAVKVETPYNVLLKTGKVPYSLLTENTKSKNNVNFGAVFGKNAIRKKPNLKYSSLEDIANRRNEATLQKNENKKEYVKGQSSRIWQELYKVLDSSDVVIHVLDARDPLGTHCEQIVKYLKEEAPHKHLIYVINKVDLVPTGVTAKWLKYFSSKHTTIAYHSNSIENNYGKTTLINLLKQLDSLYKKQHLSVGFVGYPNIGKSSIINTLRNKNVCNVAPIPGETKVWQYITLTRSIYLIDCPGVVPISDYNQAVLRGAVRIEKLEDPEEFLVILCEKYRDAISKVYNINFDDISDFYNKFSVKYGKITKGNLPNVDIICKTVLHDWNRGKIPYFNLPPQLSE